MGKSVFGPVRFSYVNVFEPKAMQAGGPLKYSVCVLIPKSDKKLVEKVKADIEAAVNEAVEAGKWGGKKPKSLKMPLRDGDEEREDREEYQGHYFINCNCNNRPGVVDRSLNEIDQKEDFYSGCFGRVSVNFYAFDTNGNRGIAAGLNNVQKLNDGQRLSGGSSASEDFDAEDDDL